MTQQTSSILTINGGSSSIKFAVYQLEGSLKQSGYGTVENIGTKNCKLHFHNKLTDESGEFAIASPNGNAALTFFTDWLRHRSGFESVTAIGHRIVHGMKHIKPEIISSELLLELNAISAFDPEHLPMEIQLIESLQKQYPSIPQVVCFDTSFHSVMPQVAKLLAIPRRYFAMGIQRYGFHGISYAYLLEELERIAGTEAARGRVVLAHLGSGASMAAVKDRKCMDTSMGFTPASGLPMSSRSGDLDPGVMAYLMQVEKLTGDELSVMVNHESGLLGISETSSDIRELQKVQQNDSRAAEAIELFCYQTKKYLGSFAAVLGGIDTLIFSGGIGEHNAPVRKQVCDGLQFLGIELDETENINNAAIISPKGSKVTVRVLPTNEELMIARQVCKLMNY